jgi:hypothetical protein
VRGVFGLDEGLVTEGIRSKGVPRLNNLVRHREQRAEESGGKQRRAEQRRKVKSVEWTRDQ